MAGGKEFDKNSFKNKFSSSFDSEGIPHCLQWGSEDVAEWIVHLGFPQYQRCFADNLINGRKLITIDASSMPRIGITDFEHIKIIAKQIRELTGLEEPDWSRSIGLHHRDRLGLFLEKRSHTGCEGDAVTYEEFNRFLDKMEEHKPFKRVAYPSIQKSKSDSSSKS